MRFRFYLILFFLLLLPITSSAESLRLNLQCGDEELQKILEADLVLPSSLIREDKINQRWVSRYQQQLPELVNDILEPYGYFHSQVNSWLENIEPEKYQLEVEIDPGTPLQVTNLELHLTGPGADLLELQLLLESFPLQVGDILRQDIYKEGKKALLQGAINLGYFDAVFQQHKILVNRGKQQVDIILQLESGIRFRFGKTFFIDRGNYIDRFLRRYLSYQEGAYFSQAQLDQTRLNLRNADQFRSIKIQPLRDQAEEDQIPINIDLEPAPKHQLFPGIGYGTDTGVRGSLRYRHLNLFHRGHELRGELRVSRKDQYFLTTYIIPDLNRADSQTLLHAGIDHEDNTSYESDKIFSEGEYQRLFRKGLTGSAFIRLARERYWIGDDNSNLSYLLLPGIRLNWHKVDNLLTPHQGIQTNMDLKGGHKALLSDISLLQFSGNVTTIHPLPRQLSLLLRLRGGATWHSDSFSQLPASLRFFAGGGDSLRGYKLKSLGPKDDKGQVAGGKYLLLATVELEKRLNPDWGIAIFSDVGNAFDSLSEYHCKQGAGIGVNYYTRIGPLRVDLARPIGGHENKLRLYLSLGGEW